jgi:hypothetical protein
MISIPVPERVDFEEWVIKVHPDLFSEWETEASEYMDVDEWFERNHYCLVDEWRRAMKNKRDTRSNLPEWGNNSY